MEYNNAHVTIVAKSQEQEVDCAIQLGNEKGKIIILDREVRMPLIERLGAN